MSLSEKEAKAIKKLKIIKLNYSKSKSAHQITNCLEDALKYVRTHKVDSVFVCFATNKRRISKRNSYYAVKLIEEDIESLTKEVENGYELLQQVWDKVLDDK